MTKSPQPSDQSKSELQARIATNEKRRKSLVSKVKIAQVQLCLDDDTYRDLLHEVTGKRSAAKLKVWELENVIQRMIQKGFKPKPPKDKGTRTQANDKQSKYMRSLWIQLHQAGKVRDRSENALVHWAVGQFKNTQGIEALQWLDKSQKSHLIQNLKQWLARK